VSTRRINLLTTVFPSPSQRRQDQPATLDFYRLTNLLSKVRNTRHHLTCASPLNNKDSLKSRVLMSSRLQKTKYQVQQQLPARPNKSSLLKSSSLAHLLHSFPKKVNPSKKFLNLKAPPLLNNCNRGKSKSRKNPAQLGLNRRTTQGTP